MEDPLPLDVVNSILLLHELIMFILLFRTDPWNLQLDLTIFPWTPLGILNKETGCSQQMLRTGWCPFRIQELKQKMWLTGMFYIAHREPHDASSHRTCTKAVCSLEIVGTSEYQTWHVAGCIHSTHVNADLAQLRSILGANTYPVIDPYGPLKPLNDLCLQAHDDKYGYVAISHVCSDGLGKPVTNSIPSCQLLRLSKNVAGIPAQAS